MTHLTPSVTPIPPLSGNAGARTRAQAAKRAADFGLYQPGREHDGCGVGFIAQMKGVKSHGIVRDGLAMLENLTHRGAVGADALMGAHFAVRNPQAVSGCGCGVSFAVG